MKKSSSVHWLEAAELFPVVKKVTREIAVVLDIGCGIRPESIITPTTHICCDPYLPYLKKIEADTNKPNWVNYVLLNTSWQEIVKLLPEKSVDSVFLVDVIEHLTKGAGKRLLKQTEKLAREQVLVFTPLGCVKQKHPSGIDAWGMKGGKWQEHHSGWEPGDFDSRWQIYASKKFHKTDNMGVEYDDPVGAFWAIKTFENLGRTEKTSRAAVHRGVDLVFDKLHRLKR